MTGATAEQDAAPRPGRAAGSAQDQGCLWWECIGQAARTSRALAHALALAWRMGASLAPSPDGGFVLVAPDTGPLAGAVWRQFREMCLVPARPVLQAVLAGLSADAPPDPEAIAAVRRDGILAQLAASLCRADGIPPSGQWEFDREDESWQEYHRRVAAGDLYCSKPVRSRGRWVIPPGSGNPLLESLAVAARWEQKWRAYQAGPAAPLRYPVFVLETGRWVSWDRRWGRAPEPRSWVWRLPAGAAVAATA